MPSAVTTIVARLTGGFRTTSSMSWTSRAGGLPRAVRTVPFFTSSTKSAFGMSRGHAKRTTAAVAAPMRRTTMARELGSKETLTAQRR